MSETVTDNARADCVPDCTMSADHSGPCCICGPGSATCKPFCPDSPESHAAGRAETVGNDGLTDTERQEYARQYRTGPAFQSVRTPLDDAGRAETTTATNEDVEENPERIYPTREGVGTGAGEGDDPAQTEATSWVTRSTDCPEAPAQAHPRPSLLAALAAPTDTTKET